MKGEKTSIEGAQEIFGLTSRCRTGTDRRRHSFYVEAVK